MSRLDLIKTIKYTKLTLREVVVVYFSFNEGFVDVPVGGNPTALSQGSCPVPVEAIDAI